MKSTWFNIIAGLSAATGLAAGVYALSGGGAVFPAAESLAGLILPAQTEPVIDNPFYEEGDWSRYVWDREYGQRSYERDNDDVNIDSYGSLKLDLLYGRSRFTDDKYMTSPDDKPVSRVITDGFVPKNEMQLHVEGKVGRQVTIYIDHDSNREDNHYRMNYRALNEEETIQEINAGEIELKFDKSHYAFFDSSGQSLLGIDMLMKKGDLTFRGFGSVTRGMTATETFRGPTSAGSVTLAEYQYLRDTWFQIEPFRRFDGLVDPPVISAANNSYATLITFTSAPADPATWQPQPVPLDSSFFALYLDDQNPGNDAGTITHPLDGGHYQKLAAGLDYNINFSTGEIVLLRTISSRARLCAVYRMQGEPLRTSDPAARSDVFAGSLCVFLKYGLALDEDPDRDYTQNSDANGDGRFNYDVYELRGVFYLAERNLRAENMQLMFYDRTSMMPSSSSRRLGRYNIDYDAGMIRFLLREPFRPLLSSSSASTIYSPLLTSDVYNLSRYSFRADYYRDARDYRLQHANIIPGSMRVRVNGRDVPTSLYSVDAASGVLRFLDANTPLIGESTPVEVRYEYMPFAGTSQVFISGGRLDYKLNPSVAVGGTVLYSRDSAQKVVPAPGSEPTENLVLEADTTLNAGPSKLGRLVSALTGRGFRPVAADVTAYAEYAWSRFNPNTFGMVMIDDVESDESTGVISLDDCEWQLSSLSPAVAQSDRARLQYRFCRDRQNNTLLGYESGVDIDYTVKPGPYNVVGGHTLYEEGNNGLSLVLDADFSYGPSAAIVTRHLADSGLDLGGLQYAEIWYRSMGGTGTVTLALDLGSIDEDADGDLVLDTEDDNGNGYTDYDPSADIFEDRGFIFNPVGETSTRVGGGARVSSSTRGDGRLNSEDLDRNGLLDRSENVLTMPGATAYIPGNTPSETELQIDLSDTDWKKARIYLRRSALDESGLRLLRAVDAVRLRLDSLGAASCRIQIDSLHLVSTRWKDVRIDGSTLENPELFKLARVDTFNDSEYRQNSFVTMLPDEYDKLYGSTADDRSRVRESALQIEYSLAGHTSGSTGRWFEKTIDLRDYASLGLWINTRSLTSGDMYRVYVGSSEDDWLMYEFAAEGGQIWRDVRLALDGREASGVVPSISSGYPDLKHVRLLRFEVRGVSGRFWVNNIRGCGVKPRTGSAYRVEGELKARAPLARTASGMPLFGGVVLKAAQYAHDADFRSPGRTTRDISGLTRELRLICDPLPGMNTDLGYTQNKTVTDPYDTDFSGEDRGTVNRTAFYWNTVWRQQPGFVPTVMLNYARRVTESESGETLSGSRLRHTTRALTQTPQIVLEQRLPEILAGNLATTVALDMNFTDEKQTWVAESGTLPGTDSLSPASRKSYQRSQLKMNMDYDADFLFIRPSFGLLTHEAVRYRGLPEAEKQQISEDVTGEFHAPFSGNDDARLVERGHSAALSWGPKFGLFRPAQDIEMSSIEYSFRDYTDSEKQHDARYRRDRQNSSHVMQSFRLPLLFDGPLKMISFEWGRRLYLDESGVPYEGEGKAVYDENWGLRRSIGGLSPDAFNLARYSPWHYFTGRGTFANGRDRATEAMNEHPQFADGTTASLYNNSWRIAESFNIQALGSMGPFSISANSGLRQQCERSALDQPGQQQLTLSGGSDLSLDLMRVFSWGFFRPNREGLARHGATITLGMAAERNMFITRNEQHDVWTPQLGLVFKRNYSSLSLRGGLDFRHRYSERYLLPLSEGGSAADQLYLANMSGLDLDEEDRAYNLLIEYQTDVAWLHDFFSVFYELTEKPVFTISGEIQRERYDYTYTVSPEPYDLYLLSSSLTLDLHRNIRGGLTGRMALENFRNRDTGGIYQQVYSWELGGNFTLVF